MAYGIPCRVVRPITQAEYDEIRVSTQEYFEYKEEYQRQERENDKLM
jgi:carbonic anhydrase/acetyltransferase-like protein (isoleucine patch superfamily)